ncbi:MAG: HPF/RaiA family ribosome-associated protein [Planctomycetes bacterium]|nr:HPF/RaiA family ribosome-associated protein [Planctomycetota bacterium]
MVNESSRFPVQITFHGAEAREGVEAAARAHAEHLGRFHPRIHGCRVVIGKAEGATRTDRFQVQLRVEIPGNDVIVARQVSRPEHEDPLVALSDAFRAAERQLDDLVSQRRGR